ncbi:Doublecortin domain-containing protein 1 [Varanus komodoensis]|nr:Doublecortin domain-containing protein 1 [Varanus komodoensis]
MKCDVHRTFRAKWIFADFRHQPKLMEELQKAHNQQFEFRSGKIINCRFPNLVLGVENSDLHSGTEVVLLEKKNDDITQQWIWREASRTFHLVIDPNLVLAVSMPNILNGFPKIPAEMQGCAVVLQLLCAALCCSCWLLSAFSSASASIFLGCCLV